MSDNEQIVESRLTVTEEPSQDKGWSWMIVLGSFVIMMLLPMLTPCFSLLYSNLLMNWNASSTVIAWIFNIQGLIWNISGLCCGSLIQEFGWRNIAITGSLLTFLSVLLSAFSPSVWFLFFSFSFVCGIGSGLSTSVCYLIIPAYFNKRKGIATALMTTGTSVGQIIIPLLIRYLQQMYGDFGAIIILSSIILNACVGAALFRPRVPKNSNKNRKEKNMFNIPGSWEPEGIKTLESPVQLSELPKRLDSVQGKTPCKLNIPLKFKPGQISILVLSSLDVAGLRTLNMEEDVDILEDRHGNNKLLSCLRFSRKLILSIIATLNILKSPRALIIALGCAFTVTGYVNFLMMIPIATQKLNYGPDAGAHLVSIAGFSNMITRLIVPTISDWPLINKKTLYLIGTLILCASSFALTFVSGLPSLIIVIVFWGIGLGTNMGLYTLVMIEVMGLSLLPMMFGATCLAIGLSFVTLGPLVGFVRDSTGSYAVSLQMLSALIGLCFLMWLFMPLATKYDRKKMEKEKGVELDTVE